MVERITPLPPGRLLCTTVCSDGLRCTKEWPCCVNIERCIERGGCFWRGWHGIEPDKMLLRHEAPEIVT